MVSHVGGSLMGLVGWCPGGRKAGIAVSRENGFHALRHYFASALLYEGVDIRALAACLGHHDPAFTLRIYAHLVPDAASVCAR